MSGPSPNVRAGEPETYNPIGIGTLAELPTPRRASAECYFRALAGLIVSPSRSNKVGKLSDLSNSPRRCPMTCSLSTMFTQDVAFGVPKI
jgi:hypothetical protein